MTAQPTDPWANLRRPVGRPIVPRPWPLEPLDRVGWAMSDLPRHVRGCPVCELDACWSDARLAGILGVSPRTVLRWKTAWLTDRDADEASIALGLHPSLIWADWDTWPDLCARLHTDAVELHTARAVRIEVRFRLITRQRLAVAA